MGKKLTVSLILLFSLFSCTDKTFSIEEKYPDLSESENLFRQAFEKEGNEKIELYSRSAMLLERAIEQQELDNGYIYYNLANAWFYAGELGKSIVNYKRAEKRLPFNSNVRNNLDFARLSVIDNTAAQEQNILIRALFFIHYDFSFQLRMIILICFMFIISLSAVLMLYKKKRYLKNIVLIISIFTLIFICSLIIESQEKREGVISAVEVIGRKGDSNGYDSSFTSPLHEGVEFTVLEERNGWLYIELGDKRQCWIPIEAALFVE